MSDSLWPQGLQHARLPCPSPFPGTCSNSCPLSWWCHPTISSSVVPFSSCLQSFAASGSFPMSWLFTSGGQSIRASASVLPMNIQRWFPVGWTGLISLQSKGLSRVFSSTTVRRHQFFSAQPFLLSNPHIHTWLWIFHNKGLIHVFCYFCIEASVFFLTDCQEFFKNFGYDCKYTFSFSDLPFHSFNDVLWWTEYLNFKGVFIIILFL